MLFTRKIRFTPGDLPSLLTACLADDERAQRALIGQFVGFARSVCQRYAANTQEADEIINEGFLKVFTHLARYDPTQSFEAWLRTVMVNTAVDYYRKKQKWAGEIGLDGVEVVDWNDDIISELSAREILGLVQQLPPVYRLERVGELRRVESRVNFVVTKRQSDDQTVATTDRPSMGGNFALL